MQITIGIPFYNAEAYLADSIRSIFAQTHHDWELLLVDDGSTDNSLEIAHSVNDPRVRVISDGENKRLAYRLNQIAGEARYDIIARMDADDLSSSTRLEKQLSVLEEHSDINLVTTGVCSISNNNVPLGIRGGSSTAVVNTRQLLLGNCPIVHPAILGRKEWFLRNPYDISLARSQDYELWVRSSSKNDFNCFVHEEPLLFYRDEEIGKSKLLSTYKCNWEIIRKYGSLEFSIMELGLYKSRTFLKAGAVRFLSCINKLDLLLSLRGASPLDPIAKTRLQQEIDHLLTTTVPGLD